MKIIEILINQENSPVGIDAEHLVFSWKIQANEEGIMQKAYHIAVKEKEEGRSVWDSGVCISSESTNVTYAGEQLKAEKRYETEIEIWDISGAYAKQTTEFETGLVNGNIDSWEGAKWIGAPEYYVASDTMSVFAVESDITILGGKRAGIVFGANDERLQKKSKNEMQMEGENYISYVIDIEKIPAFLEIYRVGYAKGDCKEIPFARIPIVEENSGDFIITENNKYESHHLRIEVMGNAAYAYVDGIRVDAVKRKMFSGIKSSPRQLNPLGFKDVTTYPRLCEIGYYVEKETTAFFDGLLVKNIRQPGAILVELDTEQGKTIRAGKEDIMELKNPSIHALPMFRREFEIKDKIKSARLYITARGIYTASMNGEKISDWYFMPGASQYDKHIMYQTYDVGKYLCKGKNGIGVTLSSGWWSDMSTYALYNYNYWGDKPSFLAKLVICYENGERQIITSDCEDWEYFGEGPFIYSGFFNGEQFDGRKAWMYEFYSKPGFSVKGIKKPKEIAPTPIFSEKSTSKLLPGWEDVNVTMPQIVGSFNAPVCAVEQITAKNVTEPVQGVYVYDLGQEITGVPYIRFHGKEGTRVRIRYAEMLYPQMDAYKGLEGQLLQANLREAANKDIYILSGNEKDVFSPEFTFHGFRYIEISGLETAPLPEEVSGIMLSSVQKITGKFQCSNPLINRFVSNVQYSMRGNYLSIPTDCPQRNERMGWTGDTHVFARTATYMADVKNFLLRNMQAISDLQRKDGHLPNIAPVGGGFGGITYESALILLAWELYQQYGDTSVISSFYPVMDQWMQTMRREGLPGENYVGFLGDWLAVEETDNVLVWNAFFGRDARYMKKFSEILGMKEKAEQYQELEEDTKKYWNAKFVDKSTGRTRCVDGSICDTQGSYAIGLDCEMFENINQAVSNLIHKIELSGDTVQTGFFGTGALNRVLSENGQHKVACRLINQTKYPSWLYPVTQGATTIWERWNGFTEEDGFGKNNAMNSFNHYSFGSVLSWCYEWILGIQRDQKCPGYKHFSLRPSFEGFEWALGEIETPYGKIESGWKHLDGKVQYFCSVPSNTTADLIFGKKSYKLKSGRYEFETESED